MLRATGSASVPAVVCTACTALLEKHEFLNHLCSTNCFSIQFFSTYVNRDALRRPYPAARSLEVVVLAVLVLAVVLIAVLVLVVLILVLAVVLLLVLAVLAVLAVLRIIVLVVIHFQIPPVCYELQE